MKKEKLLILEKEYRREDGSMCFNFHEIQPVIEVGEGGVLRMLIQDKISSFELKKEEEGYTYFSTYVGIDMCKAIKQLLDKGYYPIKVVAEHNYYGTKTSFIATREMELSEIEEKFKKLPKS